MWPYIQRLLDSDYVRVLAPDMQCLGDLANCFVPRLKWLLGVGWDIKHLP